MLTPSSSANTPLTFAATYDKPAAQCDVSTVRRFLGIVSEHAARACAGLEGFLQISRVHPADDKLTISGRFKPCDIDVMVEVATADAEAGFNSYVEARLVQGATPGRGKASHTVGVFALVADSDADTGRASRSAFSPSMRIETSAGNRHDWYFLERAITAKAAIEIGTAMRHHTGADQDTGVPTQPYRIAGTANYPGRSKQARGRYEVHPTRILEYTGQTYTAVALRAAFPMPEKAKRYTTEGTAGDGNVDWRIAEEGLPADLRHLIQHGVELGQRSEQFHHVVGWLKRLGWSQENIVSLLSNYPDGIAHKFKGRLEKEVERSFGKCDGPPAQKEQDEEEEDDDEKDLAAMNAVYAVTKVGGKTRVFELEESPTYPGCKVPVFSTIPDFCAFHAKKKKGVPAGKGIKEIGIGKWWIDHPKRRQYDGIIYAPNSTEDGRLNLWTGYGCNPRPGSCGHYLAHLRDTVCNGNEEHADYLLSWMADALQHPERASEVAVVLRGAEGVGKGVLAKQFGRLFGAHFRHVTQAKHLVGHFNAHLQQCSVLFADEAFFAGDRAHEGILKALITEETLLIEPKGVDTFGVRNSLHIVLSSNNEWVIPAGADARRFFVLDVASTHMRDYPYFAAIAAEMDNGGREALLDLLMRRDLSKFNIRSVPLTLALANQKAYSRRGIDRLIEILAHDGILPCADASDASITITTGEEKGEGFYPAARKLAPDLKHVSSQIIAVSLQKDWGCSRWKSGYQRGIKFPTLTELRERFDKRHGKQEWPVEPIIEWGG
jgi:uncharacterized protein DUF5906